MKRSTFASIETLIDSRMILGAALTCMAVTIASCNGVASEAPTPGQHAATTPGVNVEWPNYGSDPGGQRFSPLLQINRENVTRLKVAWVYHTGDIFRRQDDPQQNWF
jgi:glucose dehydrogenase